MTEVELKKLVAEAQARYEALSPLEKMKHDYEQKRSFTRGMCPDSQDYEEWKKLVDRLMPPL